MRSLFLFALVLSYKAAFGQAPPEARLVKAEKSSWGQVLSFSGSDSYTDNGQFGGKQTSMAWDAKTGSGAMNSRDWLQSIWLGQTARLCTVESTGRVSAVFVWQGKGSAPATVDVDIESAMVARYQGAEFPTVLLSNGLGTKTSVTSRVSGQKEASVKETKMVTLPVENGRARLTLGVSGRVSGVMSGYVAIRSELRFRPR
jgi:hypothetical protein